MKKRDSKWYYFLISIGTIYIILSQTEGGAVEHIYLGLALITIGIVLLRRNSKKNK